jgi:NTE family protein
VPRASVKKLGRRDSKDRDFGRYGAIHAAIATRDGRLSREDWTIPTLGIDRPMSKIGLVLGAGGLVGQAYQAGVLAALETDLGWNAQEADLIVGTSAGSLTGAMLRAGTTPFDLASFVLGRPWNPDKALLQELDTLRESFPRLGLGDFLRPWRLPALRTWLPTLGRPWTFRPLAIVASMVPNGRTALGTLIAHHLGAWAHEGWPDDLWVCAVRRSDGSRVVFGRGHDESPPLASAIAASCSIPGYFSPVSIAGEEFVDGGIFSPTNADLLVGHDLDLVVVVSPMSGGAGGIDRAFRRFAQGRVRREIEQLKQSGIAVVCFEPGPRSSRAMGFNPMATSALEQVLQEAFFEAGAHAAQPEFRCLLASVTTGRDTGAR